jgi:hypothetical protein
MMAGPRADVHGLEGQSQYYRGGGVFFSISILLVVPSGDTVTDFSFVSTVPSLLTFSVLVLEIVRSHPDSKNANAQANVVANSVILEVFMMDPFDASMSSLVQPNASSFSSEIRLPNRR